MILFIIKWDAYRYSFNKEPEGKIRRPLLRVSSIQM
jgi:hypothetical protein